MVKTNAERQAEYRLRQRGLGDKKRLNIWLSSRAHKELNTLAARKGMSQQVLIEWLLTNDASWKVDPSLEDGTVIAASDGAEGLLRNGSRMEGSDRKTIKKARVNKLLRNSASEVGDRKSGKQPDRAEQTPLPLPAQFEFKL